MIIKCKMCGGDIQFQPGDTVGQCEYCGSSCTIPKVDEEHKLNQYNRANHFRRLCEFDKAITTYERILEEDDTDAEAHWGIVLSKYGIEYVEDPVTKRQVPTCHRVQVESILTDDDYQAALKNSPDIISRNLYEEQAREISKIQKEILVISQNEKPYDVFICYKESDENGQRTRDSALAQEIFYGLTEHGYKVFFSKITLEDKLGQQYEPYIFAALNSAKVMIVVGTKPEYFRAVWVKNEWSRYLHLMKADRNRLMIPCYRDMDPYDLPKELSNLQSQDMSKIGFMQDLLRGIQKVLEAEKPALETGKQNTYTGNSRSFAAPSVDSLLKRACLFMEDGDFKSASDYLNRVLDIDPECSAAYAAKVCVDFGVRKESDLSRMTFLYEDNTNWQKAVRFANPQQKEKYSGFISQVKSRTKKQIQDYAFDCAMEMAVNPCAKREKLDAELSAYIRACTISTGSHPDGNRRAGSQHNEELFNRAVSQNNPGNFSEQNLKAAAEMLERIGDPKAEQCRELAKQAMLMEQATQEEIYKKALVLKNKEEDNPINLENAARFFMSIPEYNDSIAQAQECKDEAERIRKDLYLDAVKAMKLAGTKSKKWTEAIRILSDNRLNGYCSIDELRVQADKHLEAAIQNEKEKTIKKKKRRVKLLLILTVIITDVLLCSVIQKDYSSTDAFWGIIGASALIAFLLVKIVK